MTGVRRALTLVAAGVAGLLLVAVIVLQALGSSALRHRYPYPAIELTIAHDSAALARGAHLVEAIGACSTCHDQDLGGRVYADIGPLGIIAGPNLTRGRGGIGATLRAADWVRAIRYGVRADSSTLIAMPSEVFTNLNDADLAAIIAYVEQVPAVDREMPRTEFRFVGRMLLALGKLSILTAPKTVHGPPLWTGPEDSTAAYGKYLAEIASCAGCHGHGLSGGRVAGPSGLPPAANLTPAGLAGWTEADFRRVLREGRRKDGNALNEFMPWRSYARMTDLELRALWLYLQSVPAKPFGNK